MRRKLDKDMAATSHQNSAPPAAALAHLPAHAARLVALLELLLVIHALHSVGVKSKQCSDKDMARAT